MRILHVAEALHPKWGGIAEGVFQQSCELMRRGHSVEVFSCEEDDVPRFQKNGIKHHRTDPTWRPWRYSRETVNWFRSNAGNYDHIILNGLWQHPLAIAGKFARAQNIPLWLMPHGMLDPWFLRSAKQRAVKKVYWKLFESRSAGASQGLLFTTQAEMELAAASYPLDKCSKFVVGYGIEDVSAGANHLDGKPNHVIFMSRIHPKKGLDLLMRALQERNDIFVSIAGTGDEEYIQKLQKASQNLPVQWIGFVSGAQKIDEIQNAEAMILPSHQENFGVIVAESLALSRPVLISNKVNIWREVVQDEAGLVCDDTETGVREMLEKWQSLSCDDKGRMSRNARRCFEANFTIQAHVDRLLELMERT